MPLHTWLAFAGASVVLLLIPGPTILLAIRNRSSWSTVAGVATGDTIAMAVSLAGAGTLLAVSATAFTLLKFAGGLYLVHLGIRAILRAKQNGDAHLIVTRKSASKGFASACAVTALNPKSIVFFVAFVPQFISPHASFLHQCAILLPTFVALAAVNAAGYASVARFGYGGGAVLIGAGALTIGTAHA